MLPHRPFRRAAHAASARVLCAGIILPLAAVLFTACAGSTARTVPAPTPLASPTDSAAVAATLTRMFDALRNKDGATLRQLLHPDARFTLLRPTPGAGNVVRVAVMTGEQFANATTGPDGNGVDEPIRNIRVTVDGPLATAWAEYQVVANGAVSHCGYDAFHLVRDGDGWRVLNISDSFSREGCGGLWTP